jgi:hypothetical protein
MYSSLQAPDVFACTSRTRARAPPPLTTKAFVKMPPYLIIPFSKIND